MSARKLLPASSTSNIDPPRSERAPRSLVADADVSLLADQLVIGGGLSPATLDKYQRALRGTAREPGGVVAWLRANRCAGFPMKPATVVHYVAWLVLQGRSASHIGLHVAAIAWLHAQGDVESPTDDRTVRRAMRDARRRAGVAAEAPRRALSRDELAAMLARVGPGRRGARDAALLSLGWCAGLRRSELIGLDVGDVQIVGSDLAITVRRSKRDQTGVGRIVGIPLLSDARICAVRRVGDYLDRYAPNGEDGPLFVEIDKWGNTLGRLDARHVHAIVRDLAARAGLPGLGGLGAHSLRAGVVTELRRAGVGLDVIAKHVGHGSTRTTERYVRVVDALDATNPLRKLV